MDKQLEAEAYKALDKAKVTVMRDTNHAFASFVICNLNHIISDKYPTAATNGLSVYYNPEFFLSLTKDVRAFVVLHEIWHVCLRHCITQKYSQATTEEDFNPIVFNIAGDYVINLLLKDAGVTLWENCLVDEKYRDMSTVQIYKKLMEEATIIECPMMDVMPDESGKDKKEAETKLDGIILAAAKISNAGSKPGSLPGELEVYIDQLSNPVLPWKTILKRFFVKKTKEDTNWSKPNRRYSSDVFLPTMDSDALGHVAMIMDMSGSVSDEEIRQFVSEIYSVLANSRITEVTVVQFDTRIVGVDVLKNKKDIKKLKFKGRGGTDISPVMDWIDKNNPDAAIIFTDGYFYECDVKTKVPLVWLIHGGCDFSWPQGQIINYEIK